MTVRTKTYKYVPEVPRTRKIRADVYMTYRDTCHACCKQGVTIGYIDHVDHNEYATVWYTPYGYRVATARGCCVLDSDVQAAKAFLYEHLAAKPVEYTFSTEKAGGDTYVQVSDGTGIHARIILVRGDDRDLGCKLPAPVLKAARDYLARCKDRSRVYDWQDVTLKIGEDRKNPPQVKTYTNPVEFKRDFGWIPQVQLWNFRCDPFIFGLDVRGAPRDYLKDRSWTK